MNLFDLVLGFSLGVTTVIIVLIFKCKSIHAKNRTVHKNHRVKRKFNSKGHSYKKYVSVKNDRKRLSVNINKIKTQIKPETIKNQPERREYKDIIARIEVLRMYIGEVLKKSADMVPKVQGPPPPPPPAPTAPVVLRPPPPPPFMVASNSVSSGVRPNVTAQKTYRCIPITTELLKSVVLKSPGERNIRTQISASRCY